jgi:hypothetical protein
MKIIQSSSYKKAFDFADPKSNWHDDLDAANEKMREKPDPGAGRMHMHDIKSNKPILIYKLPMAFFDQARDLFLDLEHSGFTPKWEENTGNFEHIGIMIPGGEYKDFLFMQKTNPAKWGENK